MTTKPRYIWVKNWEQHQAERTPNWIRVWAKGLLRDDAWIGLTHIQRSVLLGIWMATSQTGNGRLSADLRQLGIQIGGGRIRQETLDALSHAGFIAIRSNKARRAIGGDSALDKKRGSSTKNHRGEETRAGARPQTNEQGEPLNGRYGLTAAGIRAESARLVAEGELPA